MSTAAVSSSSLNQQLQQYFQTRQSDLKQLGQALGSGDLADAQTAYSNIVALGQTGPFAGGNPFKVNQREQDFAAIGQALQPGDLTGAQQAFAALKSSGRSSQGNNAGTIAPASASPASSGPEIVLNLSNSGGNASPEQITINIGDSAGGGEQISLSVGNQGSSAPQVTFNLSPNSNEQIVVNLLDSSSSNTSTSSAGSSSGGLSVSA